MTIDPSVHIQSMVSIQWSNIDSSARFSKWRKARKYSSIIGRGKYNGLKGLCQKICRTKTVKMKKAEVYSLIKSCIEYKHMYDFSSFYSDTFPLILEFYAAFYWRIYLCFLHFNSFAATDLWHCPFLPALHLAGHNHDGSIPILSIDTIGHAGYR